MGNRVSGMRGGRVRDGMRAHGAPGYASTAPRRRDRVSVPCFHLETRNLSVATMPNNTHPVANAPRTATSRGRIGAKAPQTPDETNIQRTILGMAKRDRGSRRTAPHARGYAMRMARSARRRGSPLSEVASQLWPCRPSERAQLARPLPCRPRRRPGSLLTPRWRGAVTSEPRIRTQIPC
jgi:hypothetical protein